MLPPPDFLALPPRPAKPRDRGLTHVIDRGLPLATLVSLLDLAGPHIDFVKFGWGTAYVSGDMGAKVKACAAAGVRTCLGGTLLEIAAAQGKVDELFRWARSLGLDALEVSEGAIGLPREIKTELIAALAGEFTVVAEVGSKDPDQPVVPDEWVEHMVGDLEAGASFVVTEGRESGTVGIYGPSGEVRRPVVEAICAAVPVERVIFEAPTRSQQAWFIRRLGPEVNLGNIAPSDILSVETLRRGLRADTVDLAITALQGLR